jgi:ribosome production factor 2
MIRIAKPRNARSKRALQKREAKEFESCKKAVFVRGAHSSEKISTALKELSLLKKPNSIPFNKKNEIVPFEDASSLEFWGKKNDASLFVVANHQKKRPNNLTFARLFEGDLLDMYEFGIVNAKSHSEFKVRYQRPVATCGPLLIFIL